MCLRVHVYMYVCMHVCMCACAHACVCVCVCVRVRVCVCACVCVSIIQTSCEQIQSRINNNSNAHKTVLYADYMTEISCNLLLLILLHTYLLTISLLDTNNVAMSLYNIIKLLKKLSISFQTKLSPTIICPYIDM